MKGLSFITGIQRAVPAFLGVTISMVGAVTVQGASFQLDYDSLQADTVIMAGGNYQMQGGIGPMVSMTSDSFSSSASSAQDDSDSANGTSAAIKHGGGYRAIPEGAGQDLSERFLPVVSLKPSAPRGISSSRLSRSSPALIYQEAEKSSPVAVTIAENVALPKTVSTEGDGTFVDLPRPLAPQEPASAAATALALGSVGLTEAGILSRLAWIARIKSLYGTIPAFIS